MAEDGLEKLRDVIAALEEAVQQRRDLEMIWDGEGEPPQGMPTSYIVPLEKIPGILPVLCKQLEQQEAFYRNLATGLEQLRQGEGHSVRPRHEQPGT